MYDEQYEDLSESPTLSSLIKLAGEGAVARLSMDFGGKRLYIPHNPSENSPLSVSVGMVAARKIAEVYGGMDFTVPINIGKDAEIRILTAQGQSASQIARKVRCSLSHVYRVRSKEIEDKQLKLFS